MPRRSPSRLPNRKPSGEPRAAPRAARDALTLHGPDGAGPDELDAAAAARTPFHGATAWSATDGVRPLRPAAFERGTGPHLPRPTDRGPRAALQRRAHRPGGRGRAPRRTPDRAVPLGPRAVVRRRPQGRGPADQRPSGDGRDDAGLSTSFAKRRLIIPAVAFYEWHRVDGRREPFAIRRLDGDPMAMAGVWAVWRDPETGSGSTPVRS